MAEKEERFQQIVRLVAAIDADQDDTLNCVAATTMLPEFHEAVHLGEQDRPRWHALLRHLRTCPSCSRQLALVNELDEFALADAGAEPTHYPAQMAFIPANVPGRQASAADPGESAFWRVDRWGRIIIELTEQSLRGRYDLPASSSALPAVGMAEGKMTFAWAQEVDDVSIDLEFRPSLTAAGHLDMTLNVAMAGPEGPTGLAGAEVLVSQGDATLATLTTDDDGYAVAAVPTVALDQLLIEIDPA